MITGPQIRAARRVLNWAPDRVAKRARVAVGVILQAEQQAGVPPLHPAVIRTLRQLFENEGVEFSDNPAEPARRRSSGSPYAA